MVDGAEGLLRHRVLREEALYRIVARGERLVELEVVRAPGLAPGARVLVTRTAAAGMAGWRSKSGARGVAGRRRRGGWTLRAGANVAALVGRGLRAARARAARIGGLTARP
jgi:hypothetical protein